MTVKNKCADQMLIGNVSGVSCKLLSDESDYVGEVAKMTFLFFDAIFMHDIEMYRTKFGKYQLVFPRELSFYSQEARCEAEEVAENMLIDTLNKYRKSQES